MPFLKIVVLSVVFGILLHLMAHMPHTTEGNLEDNQ